MSREGEYIPVDCERRHDFDMVYGHIPGGKAAEIIRRETGWPETGDVFEVEHTYARWVPWPHDPEFTMLLWSQKGRGAFPVTVLR